MELVGRPTQLANFECLVVFVRIAYLPQGSRAGVYWLADDPERDPLVGRRRTEPTSNEKTGLACCLALLLYEVYHTGPCLVLYDL